VWGRKIIIEIEIQGICNWIVNEKFLSTFSFLISLFPSGHVYTIEGVINKSRCGESEKKKKSETNHLKVTTICDNFLIQNVCAVDVR
jgi:hypothetical protein